MVDFDFSEHISDEGPGWRRDMWLNHGPIESYQPGTAMHAMAEQITRQTAEVFDLPMHLLSSPYSLARYPHPETWEFLQGGAHLAGSRSPVSGLDSPYRAADAVLDVEELRAQVTDWFTYAKHPYAPLVDFYGLLVSQRQKAALEKWMAEEHERYLARVMEAMRTANPLL